MKKKIGFVIGFALIFILGMALTSQAQMAIDMKDIKSLCEEGYANASQTRDIVASAIKNVEKEMTGHSSELKMGELNDGKEWFEKADKLLEATHAKMEKGEYTKEMVIDLNQSWQWFIKAGSAVVRAGMQE